MTTDMQTQGLGEFARWGFTLEHPDDHIVELHHDGEFVDRFSQLGATEESLQAKCALHLVENHNSDSRLWPRIEEEGGSV